MSFLRKNLTKSSTEVIDLKDINIDDFIIGHDDHTAHLSSNILKLFPYTSEHALKLFMQFCNINNVYYYARPAESFNREEGFRVARDIGASYIVFENMS